MNQTPLFLTGPRLAACMKRALTTAALLALSTSAAFAQIDLGRMLRDTIQNSIGGIGCEKYRTWLSTSPGSVGTRNTELLLPLVRDDAFVPAFGRPYRQMTQADFVDFQRKLAECQRSKALAPSEQAQAQQVLNAYAQQRLVQHLDAEQAQRNELASVTAGLAALQATPEDLAKIDGLAARGEAALRNSLDSSGRSALNQAVAAARERIAPTVETQKVNDAISLASGAAGVQDLVALHERLGRAGLPASTAVALRERIAARLAALAPALLAQERAQIAPPLGDLGSLARHTQQLREFDGRWRGAMALLPGLDVLRGHLMAERQPVMAAAFAGVQRQIATTRDPSQPTELLRRHFMDDELATGAGASLRTAASERTALIQRIAANAAVFGVQPEDERLLSGQTTNSQGALSTAAAGSQATATRCDVLAAHPDDPDRVTAGVPDERFDAKAALSACMEAVKHDPKAGRLMFQLARAQLESGNPGGAVKSLQRAVELKSAAAHYYLSEAYFAGAPGLQKNEKLAAQLAARAQALNYGGAPTASAHKEPTQQGGDLKFADADYEDVNMIRAIYFGDQSAMTKGSVYRFNYAISQATFLSRECKSFKLSELDAIRTAWLRSTLPSTTEEGVKQGYRHIGGMFAAIAQVIRNPQSAVDLAAGSVHQEAAASTYGEKDIYTFGMANGGCGAAPLKRYAKNLRSYLMQ